MTLDQIKDLSDKALLNLYEQFVCTHHYCPMTTPDYIEDLYRNKISPDDIKEVILDRLNYLHKWR